VITIAEVETCEILCITALVEEFRNEGQRVSILDRDFVETAVIDA
jgi:hypothetical protein